MQPEFEKKLQSLQLPASFMVSDGFLWWTLESATKFNFPRLAFYGMGQYASSVARAVAVDKLLFGPELEDELITVTQFPWIKVTKNDFGPVFTKPGDNAPAMELLMDQVISSSNSYGQLVNTFYEMEKKFIDWWKREDRIKVWCVGPLCLAEPEPEPPKVEPSWIKWLDEKLEQGCSVLYVAFGSQAEISHEQLKQIAIGLEESKVNFLWVVRKLKETELGEGFEERVKERGIVVRDWVDQRQILKHQSVQGFLSHCGWNSVLESVCAGVPMLAWPMLAEQPLNARMVVEEIKAGLRVETFDGTLNGFVKWEGLVKMVKELMEGEMGKEVRKKVKEVAEMAKMAMEENKGSSWKTLDLLIYEICNKQCIKPPKHQQPLT